MHRISPDNPVRRRLFDEEPEDAVLENFANVLQEQAIRVRQEKTNRWNFDFENERPLEGAYEWTECGERNIAYVGKPRIQGNTLEAVVNNTEMAEEVNAEKTSEFNIEMTAGDDTLVDGDETDEEYESVNLLQKKNETTPGKKNRSGKEDAPLLRSDTSKTGRRNLQYE